MASPGHAWPCSAVDILQSDSAEGSTGTARTPIRSTIVDGVLNHCLNLANRTEPSVCGSDTALCQITSTIVEYGIMPDIARGRFSDGPITITLTITRPCYWTVTVPLGRYTLPVFTGLILDTRVHRPYRRALFTGSVDQRP